MVIAVEPPAPESDDTIAVVTAVEMAPAAGGVRFAAAADVTSAVGGAAHLPGDAAGAAAAGAFADAEIAGETGGADSHADEPAPEQVGMSQRADWPIAGATAVAAAAAAAVVHSIVTAVDNGVGTKAAAAVSGTDGNRIVASTAVAAVRIASIAAESA